MRNTKNNELRVHQGKNVKRFREMLGLRQEGLAEIMGSEWNQKRVSLVEAKEIVEQQILELVATALKIPVEVLENFTEEAAINYFNTFVNNGSGSVNSNVSNDNASSTVNNTNASVGKFNLLDQFIETTNMLKALYEENKGLYMALLAVEREKNEILSTRV
ncbi:helix-turn-helix transcriptional regulator [Pedobacter gandavensis]|uniref:helix-turn-helix transcriptional regulator n=1 Tax=Pedobacter gandavensis TaxID=2679963 RepID=UPI00292DB072|nr:helix-turn-helix transcriptional regulator [Pedobacter gandavensis]